MTRLLILLPCAAVLLGCRDWHAPSDQSRLRGTSDAQPFAAPACAEPATGCACRGNQPPIPCKPDSTGAAPDAGPSVCREGTRYCRNGRFGACENIVSYTPPQRVALNALVDPRATPRRCSDCEPTCFRTADNFDPADGPLDAGIAVGIKYHSSGGGVTLTPSASALVPVVPDGGVPDGSLYLSMPEGLSASDVHTHRVNPDTSQVYLLLDRSRTMAEETQWLYDRFDTGALLNTSTSCAGGDQALADAGVAGALRCMVKTPQLGVGMFRDLPFEPYATDQALPAAERAADAKREIAYANESDQSADLMQAKLGLEKLGGAESSGDPDVAGSQIPALYAIATGQGMFTGLGRADLLPSQCPAGRFGYPCFPDGARPIVVLVTDAPFHNGPSPSAFPYDYDPLNLGMLEGTTPGVTQVPDSSNNWDGAFMLSGDAASSLRLLRGSTAALTPAVSPSVVGCDADDRYGDAIIAFDVATQGRVELSTEGSSFPTTLAVFDHPALRPENLPAVDDQNELFTSAAPLYNVANREVVVHGDTTTMAADYQSVLFGSSCGASTEATDAVYSFDISATSAPTEIEMSLDMGSSHPVLALYEQGVGSLPRWPAQTTTLMATGNSDAAHAFLIPSGAGNEYVTVIGDTSTNGSNFDQQLLSGGLCSSEPDSNDAVLQIHLATPRRLRFDTEGSEFDTVLSLHGSAPATKTSSVTTSNVSNDNENASTAHATGSVNGMREIFVGDTTGMAADIADRFGCGAVNSCGDAVYAVTIAQRTTLRMQVSGTGYQPALILTRTDPAGPSGRYAAFALGESHSCALSGGRTYCWGADDHGQLGNGGAAGDPASFAAVQVGSLSGVVQVAAGRNHNCAVTAAGAVHCWGAGDAGQLGDGNTTERYAPVQVLAIGGSGTLSGVFQVACGAAHCCALRDSGLLACWGDNAHGQLGTGSIGGQSATPVQVVTSDGFEQLVANGDHTCAIRRGDGAVFCWGDGAYGLLGNGSSADAAVPSQVMGLTSATHVMAGQDHNCAVLSNGKVSCWGRGEGGRLGQGNDVTDHTTPVAVKSMDGSGLLADVQGGWAAGRAHTCVAQLSGLIACWGDNASHQLGNDSTTASTLPISTYDLLDARQVVAGYDHSCALRADGTLMCWGDAAHGKLGNASSTSPLRPVQALPGSPNVVFGTGMIDVAFTHGCGATTQPPEPACRLAQNAGQSYFLCTEHARTWSGAAQACRAVGYELVDIDAEGENGFVAAGFDGPAWIGERRESSADWLTLSPDLHFDDLQGDQVFHTERAGHDQCYFGSFCTWRPPRGFFTSFAAPDLVDSEPYSSESTWGADDEPSSQAGRNCVLLDANGKWRTDQCSSSIATAPWLTDPSRLVTDSLAGVFAAPPFAGGAEHDYACEQSLPFKDVTLDPGNYFLTVKGSDNGDGPCTGPYTLRLEDLGTLSGGYLACDDDGVIGTSASAIERSLPAGDYYLVVKGAVAGEQGRYNLTVRDLDAVQTSEVACAAGGGPGDPAALSFTAMPGKSYYALVKGAAPSDAGPYTLDVRDKGHEAGNELECSASSDTPSGANLSLDLQAGTYYAVLTGHGSDAAGQYRLKLGGASPVSSTFVPPSYADTVAALSANAIRVATVLSCDTADASCSDAQGQAQQLATDTRGVLRMAASADDVPAQVIEAVRLLESFDTVRAQLLYAPDSDPGFVSPLVTALGGATSPCSLGSDGASFTGCPPGATLSFGVSLTNPALRPVPPAASPDGAYHFTLRITGERDGQTLFTEDVPVLAAPTGAAPPMTYTSGSYHQDLDSRGCNQLNTRPTWDQLTFDADVRPDTRVRFYACTADNKGDLGGCDAGRFSSGYKRVVTITAGQGSGTPCMVSTQSSDCPFGYCSPYTGICNYLEGAVCMQDKDCPGNAVGRCRAGPSVSTLGYTCAVEGTAASPSSALDADDFRVAMRVRLDLDSLADGARTPSVFFWQAQYHCQNVE